MGRGKVEGDFVPFFIKNRIKITKNKDDQQKQQDKKDQNKQNDQNKDQQQQQTPKSEKNDNEMSKENAEQLLNSVMQDEKGVQDKVKKQQTLQGRRLEKDW